MAIKSLSKASCLPFTSSRSYYYSLATLSSTFLIASWVNFLTSPNFFSILASTWLWSALWFSWVSSLLIFLCKSWSTRYMRLSMHETLIGNSLLSLSVVFSRFLILVRVLLVRWASFFSFIEIWLLISRSSDSKTAKLPECSHSCIRSASAWSAYNLIKFWM